MTTNHLPGKNSPANSRDRPGKKLSGEELARKNLSGVEISLRKKLSGEELLIGKVLSGSLILCRDV